MQPGTGRSWYVSVLTLLAAVGLIAVLVEQTRPSSHGVTLSER